MNRIIKCILLVFIITALMLTLMGCDGSTTPSTPDISPTPTPVPTPEPTSEPMPDGDFKTAVRFLVASDVHIDDYDSVQEEARLAKMFQVGYAYSEAQADHTTLDGVFFAGDCANTGSVYAMQKFFDIVNENSRPETTVRAELGNHEYYYSNSTEEDWLRISGYESTDMNVKIGDIHVILLAPHNGGNAYTAAQREWLEDQIIISLEDDPTKARPIFVIQHHAPSNTAYGTEDWGSNDLTDVLKKYPQIVDFGGHSHYPINDPRSIWQGDFTVLNTGGLSYYEMGIVGAETEGIFPLGTDGDYSTTRTSRDEAQFYIVEVAVDGRMRVNGYDLFTDSIIVSYDLGPFDSKDNFEYTPEKMLANAETPYFPENTVVTNTFVDDTEAEFVFTQAVCKDTVQHYRCELYKDGEPADTALVLSNNWYFPMPETLTVCFRDLVPATDYTVKIIAVSAFAKESEPYTVSFTTREENIEIPSVGDVIFSLAFDDDGNAYDKVTGTVLYPCGNPAVGFNERFGTPGVYMDGGSCYTYYGYSTYYGKLSRSVSFEFFGRPDEPAPNGGNYSDLLSNQQYGGCGIELSSDSYAMFYAMVNGEYVYPQAEIAPGEYVHIVGTYDGRSVKLYINGELKDTVDAKGKITMPNTSQYLVVGGDSGSNNTAEALMKGEIIGANIYSYVLSEDEIAANYAAYTGNETTAPECPVRSFLSDLYRSFAWLRSHEFPKLCY